MAEMEKKTSPNRKVNLERIGEIDGQVSELLTEKASLREVIKIEIAEEIASIRATIKQLQSSIVELIKVKAQVAAFKIASIAENILKGKKD